MDKEIAAALKRWPNVPACYGWLSLDRRGHWRLQGERIEHAGLVAFLNAHYHVDAAGNWLVDNGPQRVFVRLDYLPWVVRLAPDGSLRTHTGADTPLAGEVLIDEEGRIVLSTALGPALLHDLDLADFIAALRDAHGGPADEDALLALMHGDSAPHTLWQDRPLQPVRSKDIPARFGFQPEPAP